MSTPTPEVATVKTRKARTGGHKKVAKKKVPGNFTIEMKTIRDGNGSRWYEIWRSSDGADCAEYLKQCVLLDGKRSASQPQREYKMLFCALRA